MTGILPIVYLARHGQTRLNESGVLRGLADPPLDETGQDQARRLGAALGTRRLSAVVASKPNAILIAPNDVSALQRPLEEAAKTSKIVLVDTTIENPSLAVSQISSDNVGGGAAAFDAIKKLVPGGGQVLVIDNQPGISTSDARVKGFSDAVKADSSFEYVGVQYAQNQPATAANIVTSTLQRYPNLKANDNVKQLQEELTTTENKIAFARQFYNDSVNAYNNRRQSFPAVLAAASLGFGPIELFDMPEAEREVPKVALR